MWEASAQARNDRRNRAWKFRTDPSKTNTSSARYWQVIMMWPMWLSIDVYMCAHIYAHGVRDVTDAGLRVEIGLMSS